MKDYNWCDYYDVDKWVVEERMTVKSYDTIPHKFNYVKVNIGVFHQMKRTNEGIKQVCSPIIRWLSEKEYSYLIKKEGVIIF